MKRRVFVMSVTQAMKGIVITSHPIITNICMNTYGFRGTLAIIAALNAHAIFGMLAMHPVEWHMKTVKVSEIELKPCKLVHFIHSILLLGILIRNSDCF